MKRLMGNGDRIIFQEHFEQKAQKMSNIELKEALIKIRQKNEQIKLSSIDELDEETEKSLIIEGIYSDELKRRELLEWALQNEI